MFEKIVEYFLNPKAEGYTLSKTFIYSIFFLAIAYIVFKLIKKYNIRVNEKLIASFIPYIILGSSLRVLEDYEILESLFLVTPWIQIVFILPFIGFIFACKKFEQKTLEKSVFIVSTILLAIVINFVPIRNFKALQYISILIFILILAIKLVKTAPINKILAFSIFFEFLITIINVKVFGFYEQHLITRYMLDNIPVLYPITRIAFLFLLIKILDSYYKDEVPKNYVKVVFTVISLMIGFRNAIQVIACC